MLEVLFGFASVAGGMFAVLSVWVFVQDLARRRSGCKNPNKDMLDFMLHGCGGGCQSKGSCHSDEMTDSRLRTYEAHNETL